MSYSNMTTTLSVSALSKQVEDKLVTFDNIIQRGLVWNANQKSLLIHSLVIGIPIPDIYARRVKKKDEYVFDVLDGKQRWTTVSAYLQDEFACKELPKVSYKEKGKDVEFDLTGKKFSDLPKTLQNTIKDRTLNIIGFDTLEKEEEVELFLRLNNGKPLSPKAKALANCQDIENLLEIGNHPVFKIMLSQKRMTNKEQAVIVMRMHMMLTKSIKEVSFLAKDLHPLLRETKISKEDANEIIKILDYAEKVFYELVAIGKRRIGKRMLKDTHFASLTPYIKRAIEEKITPEKFAAFIKKFFDVENEVSESDAYNQASASGVARNSSIQIRDKELKKQYNKFFK